MCTLAPKKDGSPNIEFYNSLDSLQGFESIRQWLQKNCKKVSRAKALEIKPDEKKYTNYKNGDLKYYKLNKIT